MGRTKYEPTDDAKAKVTELFALKEAADKADKAFEEGLIRVHNDGDVPVLYLAERFKTTRKTIYRWMGRPMK